ncbi:Pathogen-associated molecular patterns-induced protein A70, partial [Cucurbita argyrosperma subsp. sororia]
MFAESVSSTLSIWTSINSWFTPTVLFVVLNLVIGTIVIASNLGGPQKNHRHPSDPDQFQHLHRSPSMLQRLKSFNPYSYRSEETATLFEKLPGNETHYATFEHPQLVRSPSVLQRFKFSFAGYKSEESFQSPPPATVVEKSPVNETHYASFEHPQLVRSPSVFQRFKFSFSGYKSEESFDSPLPASVVEKPPANEIHYAKFEHPQLVRSPSMLQRLKFNFYGFRSEESSQYTHPSVTAVQKIEKVQIGREEAAPKRAEDEEMDEDQEPTMDEVYSKLHGDHFTRTKSDTKPTAGEIPTKLPRKMKKSASSKSAFSHFEADEIVESCRPATVNEGRAKMTEIDEGVDARADDFINRFKQQLKLQRLESILKYKDMISRGNNAK